jgi:hypothetical protein
VARGRWRVDLRENRTPGDALDERYLQYSIEVTLSERGAQIVRSPETAKYILTCLVGAIGLDINGRMFGIEGSPGGLIPFTIPELALYKNTVRRGFAKIEIQLVERASNEVVHHSGPVEGTTYRQSRTYFFVFETRESDTPRLE